MSHNAYANGNQIAAKSGMSKVIAAFPDVCLSPPSPPAGPIPVPYPNSSFSKDLKKGTKKVKLGGKPAALAQKSFYKTSPLGNEAATRSFGMNLVSHAITGKTCFRAWSMDVKFEGKNVCRHLDMTTSNHASEGPGEPVPAPTLEAVDPGSQALVDDRKCPCCEGPLHDNQVDDAGDPLPTQTESQYYDSTLQFYDERIKDAAKWHADKPASLNDSIKTVSLAGETNQVRFIDVAQTQREMMGEAVNELKMLRAANPDCRNIHKPPNKGCGVHFVVPRAKRTKTVTDSDGSTKTITDTPAVLARRLFTKGVISNARAQARIKYPGAKTGGPVHHMTPLDAGGCPVSSDNLIPDETIEGEDCMRIEVLQTAIQGGPK